MESKLPPRGTRGAEMPGPVRLLFKVLPDPGNLLFRLGRKIQGQSLVRLTTVGARSFKPRRVVLSQTHSNEGASRVARQ